MAPSATVDDNIIKQLVILKIEKISGKQIGLTSKLKFT